METSSLVSVKVSCQIVARSILRKVTKFGDVFFTIKKVMKVERPLPGLSRAHNSTCDYLNCTWSDYN